MKLIIKKQKKQAAGVTQPVPKNYDEVFLKKKEFKSRQPVYISLDIHRRIIKLVHVLALANNDISVGGYIDNVLEEHLERHKEEIAGMYRKQLDGIMNI